MTIYYVDPVGGSTTANGESYANRVKWLKNISSIHPASGDSVRVAGIPQTSVGNGNVRKMYVVNTYNGMNCDITTYSDGTKTKLTKALGKFLVGDFVQLANSTQTNSSNVNGFWRIESVIDDSNWYIDHIASDAGTQSNIKIHDAPCFYLNSAVTQDIFAGDDTTFTNWTAVSGVTTSKQNQYWSAWSQSTYSGAGGQTQKIEIPTNQATGLCAYYQLPSTLDLSSYQQISLRAKHNGITQSDSNAHDATDIHFSLRLCTDTAGQTSVHTIPLDFRKCNKQYWMSLCVDLDTNLNSSIQSIAIYKDNTQPSNEEIWLGNIIACKASTAADSLTHTSLISLNTADDPYWYKIRYISGKKVILSGPQKYNSDASTIYSYYTGNPYAYFSECKTNVAIYKMQPITIPKRYQTKDYSNATLYDTPNDHGGGYLFGHGGGGNTYPMEVSFGWLASDGTATDMTDRTSLTVFNCETGKGYLKFETNHIVKNLAVVNGHEGFRVNPGGFQAAQNIHCIGCTPETWYGAPYINSTKLFFFKDIYAVQCNSGIYFSNSGKVKGNGFGSARATLQPADNGGATDFTNWHSIGASTSYGVVLNSGYNTSDAQMDKIGILGNIYSFGARNGCLVDMQNTHGIAHTITLLKGGHLMGNWNNQRGTYHSQDNNFGVNNITTLHSEANYAAVQCNSNNSDLVIGTLTSIIPHPSAYDEDTPIRFTDNQMYRSIDHLKGKIQINAGTCDGQINIANTAGDVKSANLALAESSYIANPIYEQGGNGWYYARNYDNVSGDNRSYYQANYIKNETSTVNTAGGTAWKFISTLTNTPLAFEACKVAVNASSQVTVTLYVYTSNSAAYGGIRIKANSLIGINSDVTAYDNTGNSGWVQVTATCTPTAQGILVIQLEGYTTDGNSSHTIIVDDLSVAQA